MTTDVFKFWAGTCIGLVTVLLMCVEPAKAEIVEVPLEDSDCIKCHVDPAVQIAEKGGAHRTALGCFDCHEGHPPAAQVVIPECAGCHAPSAHEHYALDNCTRCHAPHAPGVKPLSLLGDDVPAICFTCHEDVEIAFEEIPSAHMHM
ncbi:MAG: cytochrome c3 family protein, partial [Geobacteraceae bacterium]|nr:cytochrome c3 family protein [Geobacteraceae bacterium]